MEAQKKESYAASALGLSVTEWHRLGLDNYEDADQSDEKLLDSLVERCTALLLVRILAVCVKRQEEAGYPGGKSPDHESRKPVFADLSTSTICRTTLLDEKDFSDYAPCMTAQLTAQLQQFVRSMLSGYNPTPYHCSEHAFHVLLSVNKLIDLMLQTPASEVKTFGLRNNAVAHLAMIFAALIHDVEHKGVPNRQLTLEHDPLAILYNDQSVAEQRSLHIGFSTLLEPQYKLLRQAMFGLADDQVDSDDYWYFRKVVIDLVLNTDIASPDRTQLAKSKFKEAFGDTFESMERKLKRQLGQQVNIEEEDEISLSDSVGDSETESASPTLACKKSSVETSCTDAKKSGSGSTQQISDNSSSSSLTSDPFKNCIKIDYGYQNLMSPPVSGHARKLRVNSVGCCSRRQSIELLATDQVFAAKFQRRLSSMSSNSYSAATKKLAAATSSSFRQRLGIRRSMDFTGEALETYLSHSSSLRYRDMDEVDELKAAVVMETIMTAADVAHNLQGWDQMIIWSGRLYFELRKAHLLGRGGDPQSRWFENQIGFLESYLLPLARRLEDTGVFGDGALGQTFARTVEANRDTWLVEGQEVTDDIIKTGAETYNETTLAAELQARRAGTA